MNLLAAMQAFVKVAELESYTRAAEQLEMSRTQLSKLVMQLEAHLKVRLLQRTTRRLHLTEAGERYLARAQAILQQLDDAETELHQSSTQVSGRLRVNGPMSFGTRYLAPLVAQFMVQHPELEVRLDLSDRQVDLLEEGFDLAIRIGALEDSSLVARPLTSCRMLLVASPAYIAANGEPLSIADLGHHQGFAIAAHGAPTGSSVKPASPWPAPLRATTAKCLITAPKPALALPTSPVFWWMTVSAVVGSRYCWPSRWRRKSVFTASTRPAITCRLR